MNHSVNKLWAKEMHRVIYDLLTGCGAEMHSLSATLEELHITVKRESGRDHRSDQALANVTDLAHCASCGLRLGWEFGIAGAKLQLTTKWTTQQGRRLAAVVRHAARVGYAIGLRQRGALNAHHLSLPAERGDLTRETQPPG